MAMAETEEDHEGPRVLGIGLGLFILVLLWSFSIVGSLLLSRLSSGISTAIILGASKILSGNRSFKILKISQAHIMNLILHFMSINYSLITQF